MLLCLFFGQWGLHRFYVGKSGSGILYFLTVGVFGIGAFIDTFSIAFGSFTDYNGKRLKASAGGIMILIISLLGRLVITAGSVIITVYIYSNIFG